MPIPVLIILAIFAPPIAIVLKDGFALQFFICIGLLFLSFGLALSAGFPYISLLVVGHAVWVVLRK